MEDYQRQQIANRRQLPRRRRGTQNDVVQFVDDMGAIRTDRQEIIQTEMITPETTIRFELIYFFIMSTISGCAGIAYLIHENAKLPKDSRQPIGWQRILSCGVISGSASLVVGLALYSRLGSSDIEMLSAISIICGIGGSSIIDLLLGIVRQILKDKIRP